MLHVAPLQEGSFDWRVSKGPGHRGISLLNGNGHESFTLHSEAMEDFFRVHEGYWLYCHVRLNNGCEFDTDGIWLLRSFEEMTKRNRFSTISWYDEAGNVAFTYKSPLYANRVSFL